MGTACSTDDFILVAVVDPGWKSDRESPQTRLQARAKLLENNPEQACSRSRDFIVHLEHIVYHVK